MKKITFYMILVVAFTINGCVKEDFFGLSKYANIKVIEVSNQAKQATINNQDFSVSIELPAGIDRSMLEIKILELSSFAISDKKEGDVLDLTNETSLMITAEDGTQITWAIKPYIASATPPLENGDFNQWYQTSEGYYEPGADASSTIWGTGNPGTQILNLLATTRYEIESGNYAAQMETLDNGPLSAAFGAPISAGSVFVGKFNKDEIDPANPQAAIDFGTPFAGRPQKIKFRYTYTPGEENKDRDGNLLDFGDQCDIYAYLEIRSSETTERLATSWFRSGETTQTIEEISLDFIYGELDNSYPDYMKPANNTYVSSDSAEFVLPTHLTFVASSSFDGANFAGAIGSTLILDDVELIYSQDSNHPN